MASRKGPNRTTPGRASKPSRPPGKARPDHMNLLTSLLALCAWALWGYTVLLVEPAVPMAPFAFYAALFVALTCTLARLSGGGGGALDGAVDATRPSAPGLGHAAIVSTLLLFALWLQSLRMLTPLNGTLLAAMFLFIELGFFLSGGRRRARGRRPRRATTSEAGLAGER